MMRGKPLRGWKDIFSEVPSVEAVKGYSSLEEIAEARNLSVTHVTKILRRLRQKNLVDAILVRGKNGRKIWMYKD